MEVQNIYMEKSWKKKFALRAFQPILTHCLGYTITVIAFIIIVR